MNYKIKVEFVKNNDISKNNTKAGKLTLIDQYNNIILLKVPISIPNGIGCKIDDENIQVHTIEDMYPMPKETDKHKRYNTLIQKCKDKDIKEVIHFPSHGFPDLIGKDQKQLNYEKSVAVLKNKDFEKLVEIIKNPSNHVSFSAEQVHILWFPEKLTTSHDSFSDIKIQLEKLKEQKNTSEITKEASFQHIFEIRKKILNPQKNTQKIQKQLETTPYEDHVGTNFNAISENTNNSLYSGGLKDATFADIMLLKNCPGFSSLYNPTSLLAWQSFIDDNGVSKQQILEQINQVDGFEKVGNADFTYKPDGYSVTMYEDQNKEKPLGTLDYNGVDACYTMTSPQGDSTYLQKGEDNSWNGIVQSNEYGTIPYHFDNNNLLNTDSNTNPWNNDSNNNNSYDNGSSSWNNNGNSYDSSSWSNDSSSSWSNDSSSSYDSGSSSW